MQYFRLSSDSAHGAAENTEEAHRHQLELSAHSPAPEERQQDFTLRVKDKEKLVTLTGLTPNSTVRELKDLVGRECSLDVSLIRLIFAGKLLLPNDSKLSSFTTLKSGSIVHLFPLPVANAVSVNDTTTYSPFAYPDTNDTSAATPTPNNAPPILFNSIEDGFAPQHLTLDTLYLDPHVAQTCREVRLWSILLMCLSAVTVFNNFNSISQSGRVGSTALDAGVVILDCLCSLAGLYVAQLGLVSARTQDFVVIKKYVRFLSLLAIASICMRVLWTADIIIEAKRIIRETQQVSGNDVQRGAALGQGIRDSTTISAVEDDVSQTPVMSDSVVTLFAIRAVAITGVCIASWVSCWLRAYRLRTMVSMVVSAQQDQTVPGIDGSQGPGQGQVQGQGQGNGQEDQGPGVALNAQQIARQIALFTQFEMTRARAHMTQQQQGGQQQQVPVIGQGVRQNDRRVDAVTTALTSL